MTTDAPILPRFIHAPYAAERRVPLYPPPCVSARSESPASTQLVVAIYKPLGWESPGGLCVFEYHGVVVVP